MKLLSGKDKIGKMKSCLCAWDDFFTVFSFVIRISRSCLRSIVWHSFFCVKLISKKVTELHLLKICLIVVGILSKESIFTTRMNYGCLLWLHFEKI